MVLPTRNAKWANLPSGTLMKKSIVITTGKSAYGMLDKILAEAVQRENLQIKNTMQYPEKTIRWWYQNYLPSPIQEKALANYKAGDLLADDLTEALVTGFSWLSSPEKDKYWQSVATLAEAGSFPKITTQINWKTLDEHTPKHKSGAPYVLCMVWISHPKNLESGVAEAVRWDVKNKCWLKSDFQDKWPAGMDLEIKYFTDEVNIPK